MKENKRMYTAPTIERIPVLPGNVMAASDFKDFTPGSPLIPPTSVATHGRSFAGHSDVESMINDILTIEP
jgi:hypothetical protein